MFNVTSRDTVCQWNVGETDQLAGGDGQLINEERSLEVQLSA